MELGITTILGKPIKTLPGVEVQKYRLKKCTPDQVIDIYYKTRSGLIYGLICKEEDLEEEVEEGPGFFSWLFGRKTDQ